MKLKVSILNKPKYEAKGKNVYKKSLTIKKTFSREWAKFSPPHANKVAFEYSHKKYENKNDNI
tara:strand:+ start:291 stop:479 length:189 start_codon:yes stop_codon:yes gene_type:complete